MSVVDSQVDLLALPSDQLIHSDVELLAVESISSNPQSTSVHAPPPQSKFHPNHLSFGSRLPGFERVSYAYGYTIPGGSVSVHRGSTPLRYQSPSVLHQDTPAGPSLFTSTSAHEHPALPHSTSTSVHQNSKPSRITSSAQDYSEASQSTFTLVQQESELPQVQSTSVHQSSESSDKKEISLEVSLKPPATDFLLPLPSSDSQTSEDKNVLDKDLSEPSPSVSYLPPPPPSATTTTTTTTTEPSEVRTPSALPPLGYLPPRNDHSSTTTQTTSAPAFIATPPVTTPSVGYLPPETDPPVTLPSSAYLPPPATTPSVGYLPPESDPPVTLPPSAYLPPPPHPNTVLIPLSLITDQLHPVDSTTMSTGAVLEGESNPSLVIGEENPEPVVGAARTKEPNPVFVHAEKNLEPAIGVLSHTEHTPLTAVAEKNQKRASGVIGSIRSAPVTYVAERNPNPPVGVIGEKYSSPSLTVAKTKHQQPSIVGTIGEIVERPIRVNSYHVTHRPLAVHAHTTADTLIPQGSPSRVVVGVERQSSPVCTRNSECADDEVCLREKCVQGCVLARGLCVGHAVCTTNNHIPACLCLNMGTTITRRRGGQERYDCMPMAMMGTVAGTVGRKIRRPRPITVHRRWRFRKPE